MNLRFIITYKHELYGIVTDIFECIRKVRGMAGKFVDTISIFNRKRNLVKMNIAGFAKIFHEQIDEIL